MDWFLYDNHLRHERVKRTLLQGLDTNVFWNFAEFSRRTTGDNTSEWAPQKIFTSGLNIYSESTSFFDNYFL